MKENYERVPAEEPIEVAATSFASVAAPATTGAASSTANSTTNNPPATRRFTSEILELPDPLASVTVVREYIFTVLHSRYAIPREEADAVAAKWNGALGARFRKMDEKEFAATFRDEYGKMLHEYRTEVFQAHWRKGQQTKHEHITLIASVAGVFVMFWVFSKLFL